jgi:hypothetical protein
MAAPTVAVAASTVAAAVYGMVAAIDADGGDGGDNGGSGCCDGVGGSRRSYRNGTLSRIAFQRVRVIEEALSLTQLCRSARRASIGTARAAR